MALQTTTSRWERVFRLHEYEDLRITLQPLVADTLRDVRQILYLLLAIGLSGMAAPVEMRTAMPVST